MRDIVIGKERFAVAELIGKGGEGEVYAIKGRAGQAVKIYSDSLRAKRESKVRAMVREGLAVQTDLIAYPGEIVTDGAGNFLGFVMRLVKGYRPLHELYSPKDRLRHFAESDFRFLIHAATNVARAIGKVHQTGCVIGDLNHSGILVAQDGTVALIDADSFQFSINGTSYPCVVGVPEFTAPELQGKNLATVERTVHHDNFGLAVAIFQILFMGRHPYAGRYKGPDISMGEAIAQNRFAFSLSRKAATLTTPPPGSLTLKMFPDATVQVFERAFGVSASSRPGAREWIEALTRLEGSLSRCSRVKTHYYPSAAGECVWCKLSALSGFDMFPDTPFVGADIPSDTIGTEQAIREILAFQIPSVVTVLPTNPSPQATSQKLRDARRGTRGNAFLGVLMMGGALAGIIILPVVFYIWIGLAIWGWTKFSERSVSPDPFRMAYTNADDRVQRELDSLLRRQGLSEAFKVRADLDAAIASYRDYDGALARELGSMKANREARHRHAFLDGIPIRTANISGIGPVKIATLISFGIETAADVEYDDILSISGFGEVMTGKLVAWRQAHEARFRYSLTPNAHDVADERALRSGFAAERAKLETTIRSGLGTLRNARTTLGTLSSKAAGESGLIMALKARAEAEADLRELGAPVPSSKVSITIPTGAAKLKPYPRFVASHLASTRSNASQPQASNRAPTPPNRKAASSIPDCPDCGRTMVRKIARRGRNAGGQFWGCPSFPRCKGTRPV